VRSGSNNQTVMIVGGAIGAVALIIGIMYVMSGGRREARPRPVATSTGGMSPEEARRLKDEGKAELIKGESLCRQAGAFGSAGYAAKMNEARGHLSRARDCFDKIPERLSGPDVRSMATECAKLLAISFKAPVHTR